VTDTIGATSRWRLQPPSRRFGDPKADEVCFIGGHLDSWDWVRAQDDGTGPAAVLEAGAR